jgi:2-polyprenyl-3-methyl-5-hydroxy-6-metoxy-1,4-benzoquinol methylase
MEKCFELKYYNQKDIWKNYDNNLREITRAKRTIRLIPEDVETVLDIGCGNGIITNMIDLPFVVGIDFARIPLSQVNANAIQASIDALPIKNRKFDLVILTEVLEHLDDETYIKAIKELKKLDATYYLITVPFNESIELDICKCSACGNLFNPSHHYRKFDETWFIKEFAGYHLERNEYTSYRSISNEKIIKLMHRFNIYSYANYCICNKCGDRALRPKISLIRYILGGASIIDHRLKETFNVRKPYHQIILLKRENK